MVDFVNKLDLSDKKYHIHGNVRDENYNGKLLLPMKDFLSFSTDCLSVYCILTIFLQGKINAFRLKQFQLAYICYTTHPSHKRLLQLCCEVHYMWWGNQ